MGEFVAERKIQRGAIGNNIYSANRMPEADFIVFCVEEIKMNTSLDLIKCKTFLHEF